MFFVTFVSKFQGYDTFSVHWANSPIFFISHVLEMAERLCGRIAILHGGRIRQEGTLTELKAQAARKGATLEDIFLQLTGTNTTPDAPLDWF
jgi:ABC-type multidrug transport system ATPase subunit